MFVLGTYVHSIDPIIGSIFGVRLWWYGLSYTLGFMSANMCISRREGQIGLSMRSIYSSGFLLAGASSKWLSTNGRSTVIIFTWFQLFGSAEWQLTDYYWMC